MSKHEGLVDSWAEEFRSAHGSDARNAARQPFEDYWSWVKVFLVTGGAGQRGWLDRGDEALRAVSDTAAADALRERLQALGRTIAAEWAKDSRYRRIHSTILQGSPNLAAWGGQLQRATVSDAGDGAAIGRALDAIERDVRAVSRLG
jgi:hypothetical protein